MAQMGQSRFGEMLAGALREMEIPCTPASAGIFLWVDLRCLLPEQTWEGEKALWESLIEECALLITPGKACHAAVPGFFRFCYAAVPLPGVLEAAQRLRDFTARARLQH
jgi:aspartate/methionine/tyrosine aminotransferase